MVEIVTSQHECNQAFRAWTDALTGHSTLTDFGWIINGSGVAFTNYGHGAHGEITTQLMLGFDPDTGYSIVKIVQPKAARGDKGPITVLGRQSSGRLLLLREGRLTGSPLSRLVVDEDFAELSGLIEVPLVVAGNRSERHWYVVAELDATPSEIVAQTAAFAIACTRARNSAGGGKPRLVDKDEDTGRPTYGLDEKGGVTKHKRGGGIIEVTQMQGYVYKALKKILGRVLRKRKRNGYCVDGMIEPANVLIEIKTGTSAHCVYEGVGQLRLYPKLIGLVSNPTPVLLIPDNRPLRPAMVAALDAENITVFTYTIDDRAKKPLITFTNDLIQRCRTAR
jgi:hypothetical protein